MPDILATHSTQREAMLFAWLQCRPGVVALAEIAQELPVSKIAVVIMRSQSLGLDS